MCVYMVQWQTAKTIQIEDRRIMIKKYWYEEGMCKFMQYKGQWPVAYVSDNGGVTYKKSCMACTVVENGECKLGENCSVFQIAAEEMEAHWNLRDKKMS